MRNGYIDTLVYKLEDISGLKRAANYLENNEIVVISSPTVYLLLGNANDPNVVEKIETLKGRKEHKPLGYLVSRNQAYDMGQFTEESLFFLLQWPSPLSMIVPKSDMAFDPNNLDTILLSCPSWYCSELARMVKFPIVWSSANPAGGLVAASMNQAAGYFIDKVPMILGERVSIYKDQGTVVDFSVNPPRLLNDCGGYPIKEIKKVVNNLQIPDHLQYH